MIQNMQYWVDIAIDHYCESGAQLDVATEAIARRDFAGFYRTLDMMALVYKDLGVELRGIRWNFNGCIVCTEQPKLANLQRILLVHPSIVKAAGGRLLGTVICPEHAPLMGDGIETVDGRVVTGALRRIAEEPPA